MTGEATSEQRDEPSDEIPEAAAATPRRAWWRCHAEVGTTTGVISVLIGFLQIAIDMSALAVVLIVLMVGGTAAAMWALVASPPRIRTALGWRLVLAITVLVGGSGSVLTVVRYATGADDGGTARSGAVGSASRSPTPPSEQDIPAQIVKHCADGSAAGSVTADPGMPRRRAERTLMPYEALDLDSLDPNWRCTTGAWDGHDVSYRTDSPGVRLEYRRDRKVAALPLAAPHTVAACARAPYDDPAAAPRGDVLRPPRAICVTTSDGRQALIEILDQQPSALTVRITVWEKAR